MKKGRLVLKIVVGLVVLLVVVLAGAWLMIDSLAKKGVEQGGTYALGVPTTVDTLSLSLVGGSLRMETLNIANPAGYKTPHLMRTGQFNLAVQPGSVFSDTIVVPTFELQGLDLNIEAQGLKNNIQAILDNVKKLGGSETPTQQAPAQQEQAGEGKKVRVDRIVIRDVVAHVTLPLPGSQPITVNVPVIELNNVSSDKPVDIAALIGRIMPAIIAAVLEQGKGLIPGDLLASLQTDVAGTVAALGGRATQLVQQAQTVATAQVQQALQQVAPAAQQAVGEVSHQAQGALQDAQKAAGGALEKVTGGAKEAAPADGKEKKDIGKSLEGLFKKDK